MLLQLGNPAACLYLSESIKRSQAIIGRRNGHEETVSLMSVGFLYNSFSLFSFVLFGAKTLS
jgi:hypothetical protein